MNAKSFANDPLTKAPPVILVVAAARHIGAFLALKSTRHDGDPVWLLTDAYRIRKELGWSQTSEA